MQKRKRAGGGHEEACTLGARHGAPPPPQGAQQPQGEGTPPQGPQEEELSQGRAVHAGEQDERRRVGAEGVSEVVHRGSAHVDASAQGAGGSRGGQVAAGSDDELPLAPARGGKPAGGVACGCSGALEQARVQLVGEVHVDLGRVVAAPAAPAPAPAAAPTAPAAAPFAPPPATPVAAPASGDDARFWPQLDEAEAGPLHTWLTKALPPRVLERCRVARCAGGLPAARAAGSGKSFVLYWARGVALRARENPALCAARAAAAALGVPLVVVFVLDEAGSTARRHAFLLQGWAEVERALMAKGVAAGCLVSRPGRRAPHHLTLACRAALVVSDEPWTAPLLAAPRQLACSANTLLAPLVLVDTACVVPARMTPRRADLRAFAYEAATKRLRTERIAIPYDEVPYAPPVAAEVLLREVLPRAPDDVSSEAAINALVASTAVEQSVQPVAHTPGGQGAAARRWRAWLGAGGLKTYAKRRNDPLDAGGSARMSAYLNAGMISPFAVARAAAAKDAGGGRHKFLLEMQTWRELSYAFCLRRPATHGTLLALPPWAQQTLRAAEADRRPRLMPLEVLEAGESGFPLWDAMQRALVESGELHNNCRMTWGKAVHAWSAAPDEALARLIHLNNKFALDGHAPPSYGGILWCFGGFDSAAKGGETNAVMGAIKARPLERHARRLDGGALLRHARAIGETVDSGGGGAAAAQRPGGVLGMFKRAAELNAVSASKMMGRRARPGWSK